MRQPRNHGAAVDQPRLNSWVDEFAQYRHQVNEGRIDRWMQQFDQGDRDVAARVLDAVEFIGNEQQTTHFRTLLEAIPGWNWDEQRRIGRWRFVAFSTAAGESGDLMLHRFRLATGMTSRRFHPLFIHRSDLMREDFGPQDTIVFVDDFSGTGNQAVTAWREFLGELLPGGPRVMLMLVAASLAAVERITHETELEVVMGITLDASDDVFSDTCIHFSDQEKERLLHYCRRADRAKPRGWGNCGFLVVFSHNCPNNSIPILHVSNTRWEGLFRRNS